MALNGKNDPKCGPPGVIQSELQTNIKNIKDRNALLSRRKSSRLAGFVSSIELTNDKKTVQMIYDTHTRELRVAKSLKSIKLIRKKPGKSSSVDLKKLKAEKSPSKCQLRNNEKFQQASPYKSNISFKDSNLLSIRAINHSNSDRVIRIESSKDKKISKSKHKVPKDYDDGRFSREYKILLKERKTGEGTVAGKSSFEVRERMGTFIPLIENKHTFFKPKERHFLSQAKEKIVSSRNSKNSDFISQPKVFLKQHNENRANLGNRQRSLINDSKDRGLPLKPNFISKEKEKSSISGESINRTDFNFTPKEREISSITESKLKGFKENEKLFVDGRNASMRFKYNKGMERSFILEPPKIRKVPSLDSKEKSFISECKERKTYKINSKEKEASVESNYMERIHDHAINVIHAGGLKNPFTSEESVKFDSAENPTKASTQKHTPLFIKYNVRRESNNFVPKEGEYSRMSEMQETRPNINCIFKETEILKSLEETPEYIPKESDSDCQEIKESDTNNNFKEKTCTKFITNAKTWNSTSEETVCSKDSDIMPTCKESPVTLISQERVAKDEEFDSEIETSEFKEKERIISSNSDQIIHSNSNIIAKSKHELFPSKSNQSETAMYLRDYKDSKSAAIKDPFEFIYKERTDSDQSFLKERRMESIEILSPKESKDSGFSSKRESNDFPCEESNITNTGGNTFIKGESTISELFNTSKENFCYKPPIKTFEDDAFSKIYKGPVEDSLLKTTSGLSELNLQNQMNDGVSTECWMIKNVVYENKRGSIYADLSRKTGCLNGFQTTENPNFNANESNFSERNSPRNADFTKENNFMDGKIKESKKKEKSFNNRNGSDGKLSMKHQSNDNANRRSISRENSFYTRKYEQIERSPSKRNEFEERRRSPRKELMEENTLNEFKVKKVSNKEIRNELPKVSNEIGPRKKIDEGLYFTDSREKILCRGGTFTEEINRYDNIKEQLYSEGTLCRDPTNIQPRERAFAEEFTVNSAENTDLYDSLRNYAKKKDKQYIMQQFYYTSKKAQMCEQEFQKNVSIFDKDASNDKNSQKIERRGKHSDKSGHPNDAKKHRKRSKERVNSRGSPRSLPGSQKSNRSRDSANSKDFRRSRDCNKTKHIHNSKEFNKHSASTREVQINSSKLKQSDKLNETERHTDFMKIKDNTKLEFPRTNNLPKKSEKSQEFEIRVEISNGGKKIIDSNENNRKELKPNVANKSKNCANQKVKTPRPKTASSKHSKGSNSSGSRTKRGSKNVRKDETAGFGPSNPFNEIRQNDGNFNKSSKLQNNGNFNKSSKLQTEISKTSRLLGQSNKTNFTAQKNEFVRQNSNMSNSSENKKSTNSNMHAKFPRQNSDISHNLRKINNEFQDGNIDSNVQTIAISKFIRQNSDISDTTVGNLSSKSNKMCSNATIAPAKNQRQVSNNSLEKDKNTKPFIRQHSDISDTVARNVSAKSNKSCSKPSIESAKYQRRVSNNSLEKNKNAKEFIRQNSDISDTAVRYVSSRSNKMFSNASMESTKHQRRVSNNSLEKNKNAKQSTQSCKTGPYIHNSKHLTNKNIPSKIPKARQSNVEKSKKHNAAKDDCKEQKWMDLVNSKDKSFSSVNVPTEVFVTYTKAFPDQENQVIRLKENVVVKRKIPFEDLNSELIMHLAEREMRKVFTTENVLLMNTIDSDEEFGVAFKKIRISNKESENTSKIPRISYKNKSNVLRRIESSPSLSYASLKDLARRSSFSFQNKMIEMSFFRKRPDKHKKKLVKLYYVKHVIVSPTSFAYIENVCRVNYVRELAFVKINTVRKAAKRSNQLFGKVSNKTKDKNIGKIIVSDVSSDEDKKAFRSRFKLNDNMKQNKVWSQSFFERTLDEAKQVVAKNKDLNQQEKGLNIQMDVASTRFGKAFDAALKSVFGNTFDEPLQSSSFWGSTDDERVAKQGGSVWGKTYEDNLIDNRRGSLWGKINEEGVTDRETGSDYQVGVTNKQSELILGKTNEGVPTTSIIEGAPNLIGTIEECVCSVPNNTPASSLNTNSSETMEKKKSSVVHNIENEKEKEKDGFTECFKSSLKIEESDQQISLIPKLTAPSESGSEELISDENMEPFTPLPKLIDKMGNTVLGTKEDTTPTVLYKTKHSGLMRKNLPNNKYEEFNNGVRLNRHILALKEGLHNMGEQRGIVNERRVRAETEYGKVKKFRFNFFKKIRNMRDKLGDK